MKFADILAIRPDTTDPACLSTAIDKAKTARIEALDRASAIEAEMSRTLLTADDATMEAAEREAAIARRAADRLEALIIQMNAALEATRATAPKH